MQMKKNMYYEDEKKIALDDVDEKNMYYKNIALDDVDEKTCHLMMQMKKTCKTLHLMMQMKKHVL